VLLCHKSKAFISIFNALQLLPVLSALPTFHLLHSLYQSLQADFIFVKFTTNVKHALRSTLLAYFAAPDRPTASFEERAAAPLDSETSAEAATAAAAGDIKLRLPFIIF